MPQAQVIDLGRDLTKPRKGVGGFIEDLSEAVRNRQDKSTMDNLLGEYEKNMGDANAYEKLQLGLQRSNVAPSKRLQLQSELNEMQKVIIEKDKSLNAKAKVLQDQKETNDKLEANRKVLRDLENRHGLTEGELEPYVNDPKMAQKIVTPPKGTLSEKPIDPEQLKIIKQVRDSEGFNELDELDQYRKFTDAGVSRANAESESKLRGEQLKRLGAAEEKAYDAQKDFINETTDKYRSFETDFKPKLMQMQSIPDENLIGPTANVFLETLGIPLGALDDPSSELYNKLSLDLLKGLPETYGNRILKVEVDNFLKTIPSLMNSPDGRRMIASNLLKLGEMKEVYYKEMRRKQIEFRDKGKPLPRDFQQEVFDQVKPQIDKINEEFVKLSEIKSVPKGEVPMFDPDGEVVFVPKKDIQWAIEKGGKRIW